MSNFFTPDFNNESAIAPWNTSLEPTPGIIPKLDANGILTGGVGQEVNIPTLTPNTYDNIILPDAAPTLMAKALTTDSNTSLPDSSVDLLTGQAMSEVYEDLSKFAAEPDFVTEMNVAFGENWDAAGGKALAEGWFNRDFSAIPPVKVVSSAEIAGANGAFAAATDTIYLSKEFLAQNGANPAAVADVLLEEIGHSVDARLNVTDTPGDEGAIFSRVVQGKDLSQGELQGLKGEDDRATATIDGKILSVEYATTDEINEYYSKNWAIRAYNANMNSNTWEPVLWLGNDARGFGSNTLSDGKKGFTGDWGDRSPVEGVNQDNFYLQFWTQADFQQGGTYNFNVRADDNYALVAFPVGGNDAKQLEFIGDWKWNGDAFGGKTVQFTPKNNGKYWVVAYYRERDSNAYFDISWDKVNGNNYKSGLSSLTDGQWDQQSGDGYYFDNILGNASQDASSELKEVSRDLSTALLGAPFYMSTGYAYDTASPYNGNTISHAGIDYSYDPRDETYVKIVNKRVNAIAKGKVVNVQDYDKTGKFVTVEGEDGKRWIYGHIENSKNVRDEVNPGDEIGKVYNQFGNTHFHIEVQTPPLNNSIIDGIQYMNPNESKIKFVLDNTISPLQAYWEYRNK